MNFSYYIGAALSFPLLPLMYYQGKKIRQSVPQLPEAAGTQGSYSAENSSGKTLKLITIGESTIAGVGVETHQEGFTGTLAKGLSESLQINIDWRVYARSGYTAKRVTQKILPKIEEETVDLIVIGLGGNDAFTLNSPNQWRADIQKLIDSLRAKFPEAYIAFCNMPPIKEFPAFTPLIKSTIGNLVELFGKELQSLAKENDRVIYYSDKIVFDEWIERLQIKAERAEFFSDGVHPSKLTYQTWARDIAIRLANNQQIIKNFSSVN